jgi:hypothetical protein
MSQNQMTRWIEIADERHFFEAGMVGQMQEASEGHFLHLGATVAKIPTWLRRDVYRRWLPASTQIKH